MALLLKFPPGSDNIALCWVAILDNTLKCQSSSMPPYMPESFKSLDCQQHSFLKKYFYICEKMCHTHTRKAERMTALLNLLSSCGESRVLSV